MDNNIRCIAIDDEPLALEVIRKFCDRLGFLSLSVYSDPEEGLEHILSSKPDLVFLDIEMENVTGLSIASRLPDETCFIFTTAYLNYALDGFNLDAVDYLHKPFSFERFKTAVEKATRRIGYQRSSSSSQAVQRMIVVKQEYNNVNIPLDDILYIEAMEGYCKIFRVSGGYVLSRLLLKNIAAMLPADEFQRIHRSYIVSKSKIDSYTKQSVRLTSGAILPVGRLYRS